MGFLRRDKRTLNERLLENLNREPGTRADPEPQQVEDEGAEWEVSDYWDVVVQAEDAELREDSYEFASLASGDLVVEENVEESLSALADAVDLELEPPYRAVAVRQGRESWEVSARRIEVMTLDVTGESVRLVSAGGELRLEVDGRPAESPSVLAALTKRARGLGDDYVVEGTYLDGGVWEVRAPGPTTAYHTTRIEASSDAVQFVLENGGKLYIWPDDAGLAVCGTEPPAEPIDFVQLDSDGFELYQDARIDPPPVWRLVHHRFPARVEVLWDGGDSGAVV